MSGQRKPPHEGDAWRHLVEGSSDELGNLPARVDRYSSARHRARLMLSHLRDTDQFPDERAKIADCGNYLLFHQYYTVGKVRLAALKSCRKHLLCPLCAARRGAKALKSYLDRYRVVSAQNPGLKPYLVTLTVKNGADLTERRVHLANALKRLHKRRQRFRSGVRSAPYSEACKFEGAVWSYEVTNRGNGWHPHVHAIWLCHEEPDAHALSREWQDITRDSMVVDVRPITGDPAKGFAEVFKYAMKFSELTLADNVQAYAELRGRRLIGAAGVLYGVKVPDEITDELLDDLPYIELLYTWKPGAGYTLREATERLPSGLAEKRDASSPEPVNPGGVAAAEGQG